MEAPPLLKLPARRSAQTGFDFYPSQQFLNFNGSSLTAASMNRLPRLCLSLRRGGRRLHPCAGADRARAFITDSTTKVISRFKPTTPNMSGKSQIDVQLSGMALCGSCGS